MVSVTSRAELLRKLVEYPPDIEAVAAKLREFPWDSEERLVCITRAHLMEILERFLVGELTAEQVERWADLLEMREDIEFEDGRFGVPREVFHELANPYLTEPLTETSAVRMRSALATQTI
ncbi:MAG: hypothetical protein DME82_09910 [Verrucomicrobia bacterium]|nr:MAG: hypothetical protein DME82_09910 [Verrucomicrobiota bacterium]